MKKNNTSITQQALKVALYFAVIGAIWIIVTDALVTWKFHEIDKINLIQTIKGWFYVIAISVVVFLLTRYQLSRFYAALLRMTDSELKFKTYINSAPIGIFTCNSQGNYVDINNMACNFLGYTREQLLKKNIKDVTYKDDVEEALKGFEILKQEGKLKQELRFKTKQGKVGWWLVEAVKLNKSLYLGFTMETTRQKELGETLRKRNEFIQTAMDNLPVGIALNEYNSGKLIYMNSEFERIYGWPKEELSNLETFFKNVYPDDNYREEIKNRVVGAIESGDITRMKWANILVTGKDGTKKIIVAQNIPVIDQNIMISTVRDVSAQRKAENELKNYQKQLEEIIEEKVSQLKKKNEELESKNQDLEYLNDVFTDREFRIKELKDKITDLEKQLNKS